MESYSRFNRGLMSDEISPLKFSNLVQSFIILTKVMELTNSFISESDKFLYSFFSVACYILNITDRTLFLYDLYIFSSLQTVYWSSL